MFEGIDEQRYSNMTNQELRWFDNVKKAFYHSDEALQSGHPEDGCLAELFKAVDTAKTLRRSLRGEDTSHAENRKRFIHFLGLEIPAARPGESEFELRHKVSGRRRKYTLGEIIYDIRCMIHENENLNAAENVDYHILLDWSDPKPGVAAHIRDETFVCNGFFIWNRVREVMSKFITGIDAHIALANKASSFCMTIKPELGSIVPERRPRHT